MLSFLMKRRAIFLLFVVLLIGLGIALAMQLPAQLYPQTQRPRVLVRVNHTGYSALDFSTRYGEAIESGLLSVDGVDDLTVDYSRDRSDFRATFDWNTDSDEARAAVDAAMSSASSALPPALQDSYNVRFFEGENAGFLLLGMRSDSASPEQLYSMLMAVENDLNRVEDVEQVQISNIEDLDIGIELRPYAMLDYGITIEDVDAALSSGTLPEPIGTLNDAGRRFSVRNERRALSVLDVGQVRVADRGDGQILLDDIADISISYTLPSSALVIDGEPAVRMNATPTDGGNIRQMSESIQRVLADARDDGRLPTDTEFQLYLDPAQFINRSIRNVVEAALIGAGLAMVIVFLSLGDLRNTLLIGISLPTTLILTFILMSLFGVSLNLISLGGIALAVGMVIDSSIVVIENIHRHYNEAGGSAMDRGEITRIVIDAVREVRAPVIASTLTTILVFLPISFTAPLTNAILGEQASTVVFALVFALLVALTVIPVVASGVYRSSPSSAGRTTGGFARLSRALMGGLTGAYRKTLGLVIRTRPGAAGVILGSFALLVFVVMTLLPQIPQEIISPPASDRLVIFFRSSEITDRVELAERVVPEMEQAVLERSGDDVLDTYAQVSGGFNIMFVILRSTDVAERVLGELEQEFVSDDTFTYNVSMWDPAELPLPRSNDLQIGVRGTDDQAAVLLLDELRDLVNDTGHYGRVRTTPSTGFNDELNVRIRREVVDGFPEITESSLVAKVGSILRGTSSVDMEYEDREISVSASFPDEYITGREALENFLVSTANGPVPLRHFFDMREDQGIAGIASEDGERIFRVYANMPRGSADSDRAVFENVVRERIESEIDVPDGLTVAFENPRSEVDEAINSLFVALGVSVVLIYLVVAFQFNSLWLPLVILVTVPLGFIGVILSLHFFNSTLSLNSLLGTILLAGVVVNNAILMIDFYLAQFDRSENRIDAILRAAELRFQPIMITTLTTILGMLPLALGLGQGSNIVQPLGIAVSGGLLVSTLFTLYVVPSILRIAR